MTAPLKARRRAPVPVPVKRAQISMRLDIESQEFLEREALMMSAKPPYYDITMSDVIRLAIREYRERHHPSEPPAPRAPCDVIESEGARYCIACGSRSYDGTEPVCQDKTRSAS
jgi:hypothetical protein